MSAVVVIGIGSPFGADTLGWKVIEQLKSLLPSLADNILLKTCDRPGTLLLDYMKDVSRAILIDAIEGGTPGDVRVIDKHMLIQQRNLRSSHQLGVAETIALGEKLNLLPEELFLIGVETGSPSQPCNISSEALQIIARLTTTETVPESRIFN